MCIKETENAKMMMMMISGHCLVFKIFELETHTAYKLELKSLFIIRVGSLNSRLESEEDTASC